VGPRAGLDRCGKSRTHRTVQPVAIRYTDYTTRTTKIAHTVPADIFVRYEPNLYFLDRFVIKFPNAIYHKGLSAGKRAVSRGQAN